MHSTLPFHVSVSLVAWLLTIGWTWHLAAEDKKEVTLSFHVIVKTLPKPLPPIEVTKHAGVFGKTVENPWLRVDRETRGSADVFIWTYSANRLPVKERTTRTITFEKGNYWPYTQVAARGDLLRYENKHPVADNFKSGFENGVLPAGRITENLLDKPKVFADPGLLDRRVPCRSTIYDWAIAYVFVEDKSCCTTTNLQGEAILRHAGWKSPDEPIELQLWHPHFGNLRVMNADPEVTIVSRGKVRVAADAGKDGKRLKLVVSSDEMK